MLEAIGDGRFKLYAVDTMGQRMEILTGLPAGKRQNDSGYPKRTSKHRVDQRLKELHESMRGYYGELMGAVR